MHKRRRVGGNPRGRAVDMLQQKLAHRRRTFRKALDDRGYRGIAQFGQEVRLPVIECALGEACVERAVDVRIGHRPDAIEDRRPELPERAHRFLALGQRAAMAVGQRRHGCPGTVGRMGQGRENRVLVRQRRSLFAEEHQEFTRMIDCVDDGARRDGRADRVQLELEFGDHAEIAAAATNGPEEVRLLITWPSEFFLRRPRVRPRGDYRATGRTCP